MKQDEAIQILEQRLDTIVSRAEQITQVVTTYEVELIALRNEAYAIRTAIISLRRP